MSNVKILHTGDIHIGAKESFLSSKAETRRFETLMTFEKIVNLAISEDVKLVALAGDVFDSNNIETPLVNAFFEKIKTAPQIKFVYSAGNHDPLDSLSPFSKGDLPENLYVLKPFDTCLTFEDLKLKVYGRSFESGFLKGEDKFTLDTTCDYVNLMVQHGELSSDLSSQYNSITRSFIESSGMDYIALGHIHKRTDIGKIGNTCFAYPGCPEGQGFDEDGEKGVYIGEIGKNFCDLKFFPTAKRTHIVEKIDVSGLDNVNSVCDKITETLKVAYGENFAENLYKITLIGNIAEDFIISIPEITSRIADSLYFIKIKDNTKPIIDFKTLSNETSLKGIFVKNCLKKIEEAESEEIKANYQKALELGLKAFVSEVAFDED